MECVLPRSSKSATIIINKKKVMERYVPFFAAGNNGDMVYPVKVKRGPLEIMCEGSDGTKIMRKIYVSCEAGEKPLEPKKGKEKTMKEEKAMKEEKPMKEKKTMMEEPKMEKPMSGKCKIPKGECEEMGGMRKYGMDYVGARGSNWAATGKCALVWKKGDKFQGIVRPKVSQLKYEFVPTVTGTYGAVIDMGTTHPTEHNDVWFKCDGGFNLRKGSATKPRAPGFVKIFHNRSGRSTDTRTVDFQGFSVSTQKWYAGRKYNCVIAARSTQVTVYGVAFFRCKGAECQYRSSEWKKGLDKCKI